MKAVMYIRVSTLEQDYQRQYNELSDLAIREGNEIVAVFEDKLSGKIAGESRKGFFEMKDYLGKNDIKQVYVWEISRVGRTLRDTVNIIYDFDEKEVNICSKKEGLNTISKDPTQQLLRNNLISLAEYELATIKARTISGTYNSVKNGGAGGGSIKQYGYKKENNKLLIDEEEAEVVRNIFALYLNKDYSVKQIADYLNEEGIKTRYKKLIEDGIITYKRPTDLLWTDGSVARLLHKKLFTGYRKYGQVELQDEAFRIIDDSTFEAVQIKMDKKRKAKANAQIYENVLRGLCKCGNCGATMVMEKSSNGLHNHYKCYNKFRKKDKSCDSAMINIDLLNNVVYQQVKNFEVASSDVKKRISELKKQVKLNTTTISRLKAELSGYSTEEERLVELFTKELINISIYEKRLNSLNKKIKEINTKVSEVEALNIELEDQIKALAGKKIVNLKDPAVFKSNVRELIESINITNLTDEGIANLNKDLKVLLDYMPDYHKRHKGRDKYYIVQIKMFDLTTVFQTLICNKENFGETIKVEKINPQDKNKHLSKIPQ
nr:recombinase family protein [uncultured Draconibacterium sp.]